MVQGPTYTRSHIEDSTYICIQKGFQTPWFGHCMTLYQFVKRIVSDLRWLSLQSNHVMCICALELGSMCGIEDVL
jgi:hypothetical protein